MTSTAAVFDENYYLTNNADVVLAISQGQFSNALDHYNSFGGKELRQPNATFNPTYYAINNADVLSAVSAGGFNNVFSHYQEFGETESRGPSADFAGFNSATYLTANADVAAAVTSGAFSSALEHFITFGQNEARSGSNVTAPIVAGSSFALTTGLDTGTSFTGGTGADTFSGSNTTLTAGDNLDGGAGTDSLTISSGTTATLGGFSTSNIETVNFSASGGATTADVINVSGATSVGAQGSSQAVTLNNIQGLTGLSLSNNSAGNATFTNIASAVAGSSDTQALSTTSTTNATVSVAGVETLNITNSGTTAITALTTTAATTVGVAGAGDLTLSNMDDVTTTVNASTYTGALTTAGYGAVNVTYTGGSGADTVTFTGLTNDDSLDGGDGTDTLNLTFATNAVATSAAAGDVTVSNFETVNMSSDADGDTVDFDIFSAPAFTTVRVTGTASTDDVVLTDTQSSNFVLRNTDGQQNFEFLTIDLKTSTATTDAINLTLTNRDVDSAMTVTTLTGAGIETVNITADATNTTGVAGDMTVTNFTFAAAETVTITGDADTTLGAFATTVETVNAADATGDMTFTFAGANVTATGGSGADTFNFGTSFTEDDVVVGGTGTDTVTVGAVNAAASNIDAGLTGVERFTFTEAEASEQNATFDFNGTAISRLTVTADENTDNVLRFEDMGSGNIDVFAIGAGEADGDTILIDRATDTTSDSVDVSLTPNAATTVFEGTLTLDDEETITVDVAANAGIAPVTLADIDAADATTVTFTNNDAFDAADILTLTANSIKTGATISFAGYEQNIGNAFAAIETAAGAEIATNAAQLAGTAGFTAVATGSYTIQLGDARTEATDFETNINLGASNTGADTIQFISSAADTTNDIGVVSINNFNAASAAAVTNRTTIDLSAFEVEAITDLTLLALEANNGDDGVAISASEFEGAIVLTGVAATALGASDFTFG
jgi:hypothetical protein